MNGGILADRYAKALFRYTEENGSTQHVYEQVSVLTDTLAKVPEVRRIITDKFLANVEQKIALLSTVVAPEPLDDALLKLFRLMDRNGRLEYVRNALIDFQDMYCESRKIIKVQITSARPNLETAAKVEKVVRERFGYEAVITQKVDPDIIGGFIYSTWGGRLDSSVRNALAQTRMKLTTIKKRLV